MNNNRLQETLISNFKKEFREKLGKGVKITICNKWQSEANFTDKANYWAIMHLIFEYTAWKYGETFLQYNNKAGRPRGDTDERSFRRSLIDYIAVSNGVSMVSIAKETGRSDHTSIVNSVGSFENRLETDYYAQKLFSEILEYVKENYYLVKDKTTLKIGVTSDNI